MNSTSACTAQSDGIVTIIPRASWRSGPKGSRASGAKRAWVYFNNDNDAHAPKNATTFRRMLTVVLKV